MNILKNILVAGIIGVITLLSGVCVGLPSCYLFTNPTQIKIKNMKANTEEVWKDIKGYEGYKISSYGRVKRLKHLVKMPNGGHKMIQEKILKQYYCGKYLIVIIGNTHKSRKRKYVHRLVAEAFIGNIPNNYQVDHLNTIITDNNYTNLKIVTAKENSNNPLTIIHQREVKLGKKMSIEFSKKMSILKTGLKHSNETKNKIKLANINKYRGENTKKVLQYDITNNFIREWFSCKQIERELGIAHSSINFCCTGKYKQAGGFIWKYEDDVNDKNIKYAT